MDTIEYEEWLKSLKVGDEVAYQERFAGRKIIFSRIKKITPTGMFRLENDVLFQKNSYSYYGGKSVDEKLTSHQQMENIKKIQDKQKSVNKLLGDTYINLSRKLENASMEKLNEIEDLLYQLNQK